MSIHFKGRRGVCDARGLSMPGDGKIFHRRAGRRHRPLAIGGGVWYTQNQLSKVAFAGLPMKWERNDDGQIGFYQKSESRR